MSSQRSQVVRLHPKRDALSARSDDELMLLCAAGHQAAFEAGAPPSAGG